MSSTKRQKDYKQLIFKPRPLKPQFVHRHRRFGPREKIAAAPLAGVYLLRPQCVCAYEEEPAEDTCGQVSLPAFPPPSPRSAASPDATLPSLLCSASSLEM